MISSLFFTYLWFGGMGYLVYNTVPSKNPTKVSPPPKIERNVPVKDLEELITTTNKDGCDTTVTKIYLKQINPKTKEPLSVCLGDILKDGEKTRIVKVNE